jgi:hypothetical protein
VEDELLISHHAARRAWQRAGIDDPAVLCRLWARGRPVDERELSAFKTRPAYDVEYRVAVWRGRAWLLARSYETGALVTILPKV